MISIRWSPDGKYFASASHDHTFKLYKLQNNGTFGLMKTFFYDSNVETITFSKKHNSVVLALRENNYFHEISLDTLEVFSVFRVKKFILSNKKQFLGKEMEYECTTG